MFLIIKTLAHGINRYIYLTHKKSNYAYVAYWKKWRGDND